MSGEKGFQLAGSAPDIYQTVLVPAWFGPWAEALLALVDLQRDERVLDVACGTGVVARLAAQAVGGDGQVVGLDINAPMLTVARSLPATGGADIAWTKSNVADTGLESGSFDVVLSQHGYHYFPDKPRALAELRRVLAPGGRLALSIWDDHSVYTTALSDALERYVSADVAAQQRGQRRTPSPDELSAHLADAGFGDVRTETQTLQIRVPAARTFVPQHLGSMPVAAAFAALDEATRDELIGFVEDALSAYAQGDALVYPDTVNVVIGRK